MRVAFATDEITHTSEAVVGWLATHGHDVVMLGDPVDWPEAGGRVGEAVRGGVADVGVACCWTGTGVSIAANKVPGIRAALCADAETARGARRWNDANVLAIGLRLTSPSVVTEVLEAFFSTGVDDAEREVIERVEPDTP